MNFRNSRELDATRQSFQPLQSATEIHLQVDTDRSMLVDKPAPPRSHVAIDGGPLPSAGDRDVTGNGVAATFDARGHIVRVCCHLQAGARRSYGAQMAGFRPARHTRARAAVQERARSESQEATVGVCPLLLQLLTRTCRTPSGRHCAIAACVQIPPTPRPSFSTHTGACTHALAVLLHVHAHAGASR